MSRFHSPHLAQVELRIFFVGNALNLDKRGVGTSVALSTLVAKDTAFGVQSVEISVRLIIHSASEPSSANQVVHRSRAAQAVNRTVSAAILT